MDAKEKWLPVKRAEDMLRLMLEPNSKLPVYAATTLISTMFIIYQINYLIDSWSKIKLTEAQTAEFVAPLPTTFLAIFLFFLIITVTNFEKNLIILNKLLIVQKKLEELIKQTSKEGLDNVWAAEAAGMGVLATGLSKQKNPDLFNSEGLFGLEQLLIQLTEICAQYFILSNQLGQAVSKEKMAELVKEVSSQTQVFWQKMKEYCHCQTAEQLGRKLIEVFRANDPYLLEKLQLVAKQTFPNGESVWPSNDKPHTRSLTSYEPQTVLAILSQLVEPLATKLGEHEVLFLSEAPDSFVSSLLATHLRQIKPSLTIEQALITEPISRGADAIKNTAAKLHPQITAELKAGKYHSLVFVTNYPEEETRLRSIIYDLLGASKQINIFIISINGGRMVANTLSGEHLQALESNLQPQTVDQRQLNEGKFFGASVFQVDTQAVFASPLFADHLEGKAVDVHPDTSLMISARKAMIRNGELAYQNGEWQVIGDDGHFLRVTYLLAFGLIKESEIKAIIEQKGLRSDIYNFLLEALQKLDGALDEYQPPWNDKEQWNRDFILEALNAYAPQVR